MSFSIAASKYKTSHSQRGKRKLDFNSDKNANQRDTSSNMSMKNFKKNSSTFKRKSAGAELDVLNAKESNFTKKSRLNVLLSLHLDCAQRMTNSKDEFSDIMNDDIKTEVKNSCSEEGSPEKILNGSFSVVSRSKIYYSNELNLHSGRKNFQSEFSDIRVALDEQSVAIKAVDEQLSPFKEETDKISNTSSPDIKDINYYEEILVDPSPIKTPGRRILYSKLRKEHPNNINLSFKSIEQNFLSSKIHTIHTKSEDEVSVCNFTGREVCNSHFEDVIDEIHGNSPEICNRKYQVDLISQEISPVKEQYSVLRKKVSESCELNFPNIKQMYSLKTNSLTSRSYVNRNLETKNYFEYESNDLGLSKKNVTNFVASETNNHKERENFHSSAVSLLSNKVSTCHYSNDCKMELDKNNAEIKSKPGEEINTNSGKEYKSENLRAQKEENESCIRTIKELSGTCNSFENRFLFTKKSDLNFKGKRCRRVKQSSLNKPSVNIQSDDRKDGETKSFIFKYRRKKSVGRGLMSFADLSSLHFSKSFGTPSYFGKCERDQCINNEKLKDCYHDVESGNLQERTVLNDEHYTLSKNVHKEELSPLKSSDDGSIIEDVSPVKVRNYKSHQISFSLKKVSLEKNQQNLLAIKDKEYLNEEKEINYNLSKKEDEYFSSKGSALEWDSGQPIISMFQETDKFKNCVEEKGFNLSEEQKIPLDISPSSPISVYQPIHIEETPPDKSVPDLHITAIQDLNSQSYVECIDKVENPSDSSLSENNSSNIELELCLNYTAPEPQGDLSKNTRKSKEFYRKRIKRGSLLERAHKIAVNLKNENNLFTHEINFGLRCLYEGPFISDKLQVTHLWKEDEMFFLKCSPFHFKCNDKITLVVSELPSDITIHSILVIHFPVKIIFKTDTLEALAFVRNRITSCKQELINMKETNDSVESTNFQKKICGRKIIRTLRSRLSKNILDSVVGFYFIEDGVLELTVLHIRVEELESTPVLHLLTLDPERLLCFFIIKGFNSFYKCDLSQVVEGETYEFVGFKFFDIILIDSCTLSFVEYLTLCPPKSNILYQFQPIIRDCQVKLLRKNELLDNRLTSLLSIKHIMSDFKRFKVLVEKCISLEKEIRIYDSSLMDNEHFVLRPEVDFNKKMLTVPFILDGVYYLKGDLIFDTYSKISISF